MTGSGRHAFHRSPPGVHLRGPRRVWMEIKLAADGVNNGRVEKRMEGGRDHESPETNDETFGTKSLFTENET